MMDMSVWQEYMKLLDRLGDALEKLTGIERAKTAAVAKADLSGVEECLKQEQVMSLSLRGLDQKREKLLGQLGLTGVHLRDLEAHSPAECRMETKRAVEGVQQKYRIFQSASEVARNALESNLHVMERLQKEQNADPADKAPHLQADFTA